MGWNWMEWDGTSCCSLFGKLLAVKQLGQLQLAAWNHVAPLGGGACAAAAVASAKTIQIIFSGFGGSVPPSDTDSHSCPSNGQRVHRWNEIGFWFCPRLLARAQRSLRITTWPAFVMVSLPVSLYYCLWWLSTALDQNSLYFGSIHYGSMRSPICRSLFSHFSIQISLSLYAAKCDYKMHKQSRNQFQSG